MGRFEDIKKLTEGHSLFRGLTDVQLDQLFSMMREVDMAAGQYLFHEGDSAGELYLIMEGEVEVVKKEADGGGLHRLTILGRGATFGEIPLLDGKSRSASVRTVSDTALLKLTYDDLHTFSSEEDSIEACIMINLGGEMGKNIRSINETTVKLFTDQLREAKAKAASGVFISSLFVGICCYVFALQIITAVVRDKISTSVVTIPAIMFFFGPVSQGREKQRPYAGQLRNNSQGMEKIAHRVDRLFDTPSYSDHGGKGPAHALSSHNGLRFHVCACRQSGIRKFRDAG